MDKGSPILLQIFKEESQLDVWKKNENGEFALLKTFPICRWSGALGPKKKEGDRQAPEGFYTITRAQMNPNSSYYLSFNTGYPNAFDRAWGRTGSELMVHGDCSSRGCYAMTDEQIQEIYALARESFFGGQREFQLQAYPFRMTALNMAKHRNNPNFAFWKQLKQGYDAFQATHQEPKVAVCEKHYVFDAAPPPGASGPLNFNPGGKCPVYQLDPMVAQTILDHRRQEQFKMAQYIADGVSVEPIAKGADGGMNPVFADKLAPGQVEDDGRVYSVASVPATRVSLPAPSSTPAAMSATPVTTAVVPMPERSPLAKPAKPKKSTIASLIGGLFGGSSDNTAPAHAAPAPRISAELAAKPKRPHRVASTPPVSLRLHATRAKPHTPPKAVARNAPAPKHHRPVKQAAKKQVQPKQTAKRAPAPESAPPSLRTAFTAPTGKTGNSLLTGAQPPMPTGSFSARWSAMR